MNFEDVPVGAAFVWANVGGKDHACMLLEPWTETPVPSIHANVNIVRLSARCRSWHVLAKGYPEDEFDHTEPLRFQKGDKTWAHVPKS